MFESEIYVGTNRHFNPIVPSNVEILKENPIYDYICNDCFCEFTSYNQNHLECNICGSEDIHRKLI